MKNRIYLISFFLSTIVFLLISINGTNAQNLDYQNVITIVLDDDTPVVLYGKAGSERMTKTLSVSDHKKFSFRGTPGKNNFQDLTIKSSIDPISYGDDYYFTGDYYYLPTNLRLSKRPDGVPEFLFLKYTTEERVDQGGIQGGLMHFLMQWGLTKAQEEEVQTKLDAKYSQLKRGNPKFARTKRFNLMGPVKLSAGDEGSFRIISATLSDKTLAPSVVLSSKAPTLPGQKVAAAARLDKNGCQLLAATFEKNRSITDLSIECFFKYKVLMPAVKGRITVDWSKMTWDYVKDYVKKETNGGDVNKGKDGEDNVKITDANLVVNSMLEAGVVDMQLDNFSDPDDPIAQEIVAGFMQALLESMSADDNAEEQDEDEEYRRQDAPTSRNYTLDVERLKIRMAKGKEVINLNYRTAIMEEVGITGNLGSWYDGVRNNRKCVSSVNLNDPFFQHRDINLILDIEGEEMFGKEANYVTVNIRKRRSRGNDFQDHVTIDRTYLENKGTLASVTYARGEDRNPDAYEYKAQWSLKGGKLYPENPRWIKGEWEGVTLAPPIKPRVIEFEADLDEMKSQKITRATLQVRYYKYGKEIETNIPLTVSKGIPLVDEMIFTDREQDGYAYRFILNHAQKGKMATEWEARYNDDYVYATLPKQFLLNDEKFVAKMIEAAQAMVKPNPDGTVKSFDTILNKILKGLEIMTKDE